MTQGIVVLLVALVAAGGFGLVRASRDGRFRGTHGVRSAAVDAPPAAPTAAQPTAAQPTGAQPTGAADDTRPVDVAGLGDPGERATLLQFSSAFCAPCRATRRVLAGVADVVPGVAHVEVDAEHHLDLVRRLGVLRTPTTLVLDASGRELARATGAPRQDEVLATLARVLAD
jgi:thiol-disulfide isomerase/thioredoxin